MAEEARDQRQQPRSPERKAPDARAGISAEFGGALADTPGPLEVPRTPSVEDGGTLDPGKGLIEVWRGRTSIRAWGTATTPLLGITVLGDMGSAFLAGRQDDPLPALLCMAAVTLAGLVSIVGALLGRRSRE